MSAGILHNEPSTQHPMANANKIGDAAAKLIAVNINYNGTVTRRDLIPAAGGPTVTATKPLKGAGNFPPAGVKFSFAATSGPAVIAVNPVVWMIPYFTSVMPLNLQDPIVAAEAVGSMGGGGQGGPGAATEIVFTANNGRLDWKCANMVGSLPLAVNQFEEVAVTLRLPAGSTGSLNYPA